MFRELEELDGIAGYSRYYIVNSDSNNNNKKSSRRNMSVGADTPYCYRSLLRSTVSLSAYA
ncbi:hypothetical protein VSDG_03702 [Cytospora chrysosperma]|uniref:Uncharacterized protein n=1 Tax=Cytospora chrysosperma TaxID=252740 RepID=A0A423W685_CYTCH|nr:hypothetical protein VSDG_03702 [Valsa sordida]